VRRCKNVQYFETTRIITDLCNMNLVAVGGLVVARLPLDPRFVGSDPAEDDGSLRTTKILSTTSFGGEVKAAVRFYGMLKNPLCMIWTLGRRISVVIFSPSFSCFATEYLAGKCRRALMDELGLIRNIIDQKWSRCKGRLLRPPHKDKR
jgi:hypothetical protein